MNDVKMYRRGAIALIRISMDYWKLHSTAPPPCEKKTTPANKQTNNQTAVPKEKKAFVSPAEATAAAATN